MRRVLRVLNGRRAGAVFVLRERTVIGRAGHVDIQLVNDTVSRQHAKLTVDDARGEVVLTDLSSDNGTFVNGEAVARRVLRIGDTISVADTRFVYEEIQDDPRLATSQAFTARSTSTESMRQTAPHRIVLPTLDPPTHGVAGRYHKSKDGELPRRERVKTPTRVQSPVAAPTPTRLDPEPAAAGSGEYRHVRRPGSQPEPTPAQSLLDDLDIDASEASTAMPVMTPDDRSSRRMPTGEYPRVETNEPHSRFDRTPQRHVFRRRRTREARAVSMADEPSGEAAEVARESYGEDALLDVLAYRHLRLRSLRGDPLDAKERARFAALERRLEREPEDGDALALARRFHRFACALPVRMRLRPGSEGVWGYPGRMLDLSAGGAQVAIGDALVEPGDTIWIAVDLRRLERTETTAGEVMLESRVIWRSTDGTRIGVIFAGEAIFSTR